MAAAKSYDKIIISACSEETAKCLFLRGKALNVMPHYDPMAQDALSKAVKMNPKLVEAWNCLGECYWKNGQVEAARNCFVGALNHVSLSFNKNLTLLKKNTNQNH